MQIPAPPEKTAEPEDRFEIVPQPTDEERQAILAALAADQRESNLRKARWENDDEP